MPPCTLPAGTTTVPYDHYTDNYLSDGLNAHTYDLFVPQVAGMRPLVVHIHGGGFVGGNKCGIVNSAGTRTKIGWLLDHGIAFVTINYSLLKAGNTVGINACYDDCKAFIQHIRSKADDYNLNKNKIAFWSMSAGAGLSMLMGFRKAEFPYVKALVVQFAQASYDLMQWKELVFSGMEPLSYYFDILTDQGVRTLYGCDAGLTASNYDSYPKPTNEEDVDMLTLMQANAPPLWVENRKGAAFGVFPVIPPKKNHLNHHLYHSRALIDRANFLSVECHYRVPHLPGYVTSGTTYNSFLEFLKDKLT